MSIWSGKRLRLDSEPFNPFSNRRASFPGVASGENGPIVGRDLPASDDTTEFFRATWTIRISRMRGDPKVDYTSDIPRGALVWIRRIPEKRGDRGYVQKGPNNGSFHSFDYGIYHVGVTTPVLNMLLARQARFKVGAPGASPTPSTAYNDWCLGGVCSSNTNEIRQSTDRTLVLDRLNDTPVINVWNPQLEPQQYLFMAFVAQRTTEFVKYFPHSNGMDQYTFTNVSEDTPRKEVPYIVQALPLVSDAPNPPMSCLTTHIRHPDSSTTPVVGHAVRVGTCMYPVPSQFRWTGDYRPFLNDISATEVRACVDMTKMRNLADVDVRVGVSWT